MKTTALITIALLAGCAFAPAQPEAPTWYMYKNTKGAAMREFGSDEASQAALEMAFADCNYKVRQMAMVANGNYLPGNSTADNLNNIIIARANQDRLAYLYADCMTAKGWFRQ